MENLFEKKYFQVKNNDIGIVKANISLTMFHEGRIMFENIFKDRNLSKA